jgi:hypothetical protein
MRETMCKQKAVLETIKQMKGRGRMSASQIKLAEAQVEDYQDMKKEILEIKQDVLNLKDSNASLNGKVDTIGAKLDLLIQQGENKPLLKTLVELSNNKFFWLWLLILTLLVFGVSISDLKGLWPIGG